MKGLAVRRGGTSISHLLFADDNILFCGATKEEWSRVKKVLNLYERGSGQIVNNKKSSIFSSFNTSRANQTAVTQEIGGGICGNYDKYLGLLDVIGRSKYNIFHCINEMVWNKIFN